MRLSVVIANYNYAHFLAEAIDSALALEWPDVEVVVVDNGSTDDSRDVVSRYSGRVTALHLEHGQQREAANAGFLKSTGDVVIFLDADDVLPPEAARRIAEAMGPRTSKVQLQMQRVDPAGRPLGEPFPSYAPAPPTPEQVRRWVLQTSAYPTPPGSGNAYARWYLERILPAGPDAGDFLDSVCLAAAPLLGDVVSLPGVCVGYRQHPGQDSALLTDPTRFSREVQRARVRWTYAQRAAGLGPWSGPVAEAPLFRSRELLQFRCAAARLAPRLPGLPGDSAMRRLADVLRSPGWPGPEPLGKRLSIAAWSLLMQLAPRPLLPPLLRMRYGR
ncbi:Glycosyl transferase family 2 [Quadrisphaera granulorum]|uniref:Glycosyl transferase family 2 n=1 Tax=Quadrisphaera granulorum TaxID=317664 RepID=A0A316AD06_9ACTN|nr:glycosyltransferase [Quadrisphaera granulorum]PWJ55128.1 glycosyl transferase family 2 [Quadrisphaera granulorum]SZE95637.1 Glycosyl transferase family 2 [Quadrisphaera granulorum]